MVRSMLIPSRMLSTTPQRRCVSAPSYVSAPSCVSALSFVLAVWSVLFVGSVFFACGATLAQAQDAQQDPIRAKREQRRKLVEHVLPLEREMGTVRLIDLDDDGSKELLVLEGDRDSREYRLRVAVYTLREGKYVRLSRASAELPAGVSAVDVGRFSFGKALIFISPNRVHLWPWREDVFDEQTRLEWEVAGVMPLRMRNLRARYPLLHDLNEDGRDELVLPTLAGGQVWGESAQGEWTLRAQLQLHSYGDIAHVPYSGNWYLWHNLIIPHVLNADGQGWRDIALFDEGLLTIFSLGAEGRLDLEADPMRFDFQPPQLFDPQKPEDPSLKLIRAEDLNGDKQMDLVFSKTRQGNSVLDARTLILVHYGKQSAGKLSYTKQADQVFVGEGFALPLILDLNGDGLLDLVSVNVEAGFWNFVRGLISRTIVGEAGFYPMGKDGRYPKRPSALRSYQVNFSLGRRTHQPIFAFGDLNGDGWPDLLLSRAKNKLGVHWGQQNEFWSKKPNETLKIDLPTRRNHIWVEDVNHDRRDDLVLIYLRGDIRLLPHRNKQFLVLQSMFDRTP